MPSAAEFPHYADPPVHEVAVGLQFAPLAELTTAHVGSYWHQIRDRFPNVEEQAPVQHIVELPPGQTPDTAPEFSLELRPPLLRTWFKDETGRILVQVQRDRFLYNWRKTDKADVYVRFPPIKAAFLERWQEFLGFLEHEGLAQPQVDQCELTYVNRIDQDKAWRSIGQLERVFTSFRWRPRDGFLPEPENARWNMRFLLPDGSGRLHVDVVPVRTGPEQSLAIRFSLTARGLPASTDESAIAAWFDMGHEWIVKGFVDLVSEETDDLWGRQRRKK